MKKVNRIFNKKRVVVAVVIITIAAIAYYQLDYKRHFIGNKNNTEFITIWQRIGNNCYIIPGKYYRVFAPKDNYIKTANYRNYIGLIWDTKDKWSYKISIYNEFEAKNFKANVNVYSSNDSLLLEYNMLKVLDHQRGKRIKNPNADSLKRIYDYNYIDLNKIYGIKVHDYK